MTRVPLRDLRAEVAKHFRGTPQAGMAAALRLGEQALDLFLATLPAGTTRAEARARMRRTAQYGRRRSAVVRAIGKTGR